TGYSHSCALATNGAAYCWGYNGAGQLGDNTTTNRATPVPVVGGVAFASISAGDSHTCGVSTTGVVWCWGANYDGRLGDGTSTSRSSPVQLAGPAISAQAVSAGGDFTCALNTGGQVYCWGGNWQGQLGDGTLNSRNTPGLISGGFSYKAISAGGWGGPICAIMTNDLARCWGKN